MLRLERVVPALLTLLAMSCRQATLPEADARTGELAAGQRIFLRKCASCHNSNGDGKTVTASRFPYANLIDGVWRSDGSPEAIERQIRRGRDPMPKFEGKLTDEQIRQAVAYVLELSRAGAAAGGKGSALRSLGEEGAGGVKR